ncbi:hypothetical protein [Hydrogenophaga sp.]|uniref:hypothetical protein n=1 Tax=Hydrogenophaga sp. TaxID=1904254 RepID=UPI0025C349A1|nr:hypothetical protein [Hydrogenophaga sp.]
MNFLQSLLSSIRPPAWVVAELQNRVLLFLNHVLQQEPVAQERLRRQQGKPVLLQWGDFHFVFAASAAGLLERAGPEQQPELKVMLVQTSPLALAQRLLAGDKPAVEVQGDVQLAADLAWLIDNVRWDPEEDLARLIGDAPAHTLARLARAAAQAVKVFAARLPPGVRPAAPTANDPTARTPDAGNSGT